MLIDLPNTTESLSPLGRALPCGTTRHLIKDGPAGTAQTIAMMQKLVNSGKRDNKIRELCGQILNPKNGTRPCASKDYFCYAKALYEYVKTKILYAYDPNGVEYLEKASVVASNGIADCDSMDILLCSMFEHVGLQSQFVTIKADPNRPNEFTHVFTRVMIPKMGWVCADPIMPDKWFGWEPPFPNGRKYWAATSDALNQTLDESPSIPFPSPGQPGQSMDFSPVDGMSGLGSLGRGGHGHGGRGRRNWGGGGYGWGGPGYWGGGFDDNVYILPVVAATLPMPDQMNMFMVPEDDTDVQALENPLMEQSSGMGHVGGFIDDAVNKVKGAIGIVAGAAGVSPDITQVAANAILGSFANGTEAKKLNAQRQKIYSYVDKATAALNKAKALPDSSPIKSAAISAANALRSAAYDQQYALNDAMANYNKLAAFINNLPYTGSVVPALNGMSGWPLAVGAGLVVVGASGLWLVHDYQVSMRELYKKEAVSDQAAVDRAIIELARTDPQTAIALSKRGGASGPAGQSQPVDATTLLSRFADCVGNPGTCLAPIVNYALVAGGAYLAYKAISFAIGVKAESYKVRAIRKAEVTA